MTDFPFDASGCCPACGDMTDEDSLLCEPCADMVRHDPRTGQPSREVERTCESCGQPADSLGCRPKRWDDVQFLRDCGIQPIAI
jgi:hypothetical protein